MSKESDIKLTPELEKIYDLIYDVHMRQGTYLKDNVWTIWLDEDMCEEIDASGDSIQIHANDVGNPKAFRRNMLRVAHQIIPEDVTKDQWHDFIVKLVLWKGVSRDVNDSGKFIPCRKVREQNKEKKNT